MKVNLCIIATAKYIKFLPKLIESVQAHWMHDMVTDIHIFTNRIDACKLLLSQVNYQKGIIEFHEVDHGPWPHATLYRYHFFKKHHTKLTGNYIFYIDADTIITSPITKAILSPRTVVRHCGYVNGGGTFETRKESMSYVPMSERILYCGGGFWGMDRINFLTFIDKATEMINIDLAAGIMPIWHDESVLNCYMSKAKPIKVLSPAYHYPESNPRIWGSWPEQYPCKILLLNKDHKEIRK